MLLTKVAWVELGSKLYDTIFRVAPELQNMFSKSSVAMGIKMIDMIDSMVNAVDDLHTLHSKMESLGPVHNKNRVKAVEHMGIFESVIVDLLVTNLKEQLTQEMRTGWKWLWAWLTESMLVVEKAYDTASSLIQQSWDSTLERCSPEEIGDCIYDTLFQIAPNLRHLFSKPKEIMAMKLVGIVGALVALSAHPETVDEVVRDLGRRHVTYGVASHHVPVMKQAIIAVLERMLGENWDARTSKAWNELWDVSATAMMKAIDDGRDFGGAMENLWERVKGKVARNKFALQLYSRLTNANPELVLVFMNAGSKEEKHEEEGGGAPAPAPAAGGGAKGKGGAAGSAAGSVIRTSVAKGSGGKSDTGSVNARTLGVTSKKGLFSSKKDNKKPKMMATMLDAVERVTGLDLDGDGTLGGELEAEVDNSAAAQNNKKTKFNRLAWGFELYDLLETSIELMYEPELQKQRLTVVGNRFFSHGCRTSHLKTIGQAMQGVFGEILIVHTKTPWSPAETSAWDWFWGHVEAALRWPLEACEHNLATRVEADWRHIRETLSDEEFGEIFYAQMQDQAPDMLRLFVRPRKLQYSTFVSIVDLLVRFAGNPEIFYDQIKPLAILHMKHGVSASEVKRFENVLFNVLRRALKDRLDETGIQAWKYSWVSVSRCLADCLNVGGTLVTMALVSGDVEELNRALWLAPRGQRADWVARVQIHDSVVSPLYWAVRDGKLDMARLMIRDMLALRADRDAYYYGYDRLWEAHADIVTVLCKFCPELLDDLFDGMLWHSGTVEEGGRVRVNYYIRELYGDPEVYTDAWDAPLAVLAVNGPSSIFVHPLVRKVLDIKWRRFGLLRFLLLQSWYVLILLVYEVAFVTYDAHVCARATLRVAAGALGGITFLAQNMELISQVRSGQVGEIKLPFLGWGPSVPRWLHKPWNCLRYITMALLAGVCFTDPCVIGTAKHFNDDNATEACLASAAANDTSTNGCMDSSFFPRTKGTDVTSAMAGLLLWMGLFQLSAVSHRLSAFIFTVGSLVEELSRTLAVLGLVIMAFATALVRLDDNHPGTPFPTLQDSAFSLVRRLLLIDAPDMTGLSVIGWFFFILFCLLSAIGIFNILIAQLDVNVRNQAALTESYAVQNRIQLALEVESTLSLAMRKLIWRELKLDSPLEFEKGYLGPAGGIQCLESASVMRHPKYVKDRVIRVRGDASPLLPWPPPGTDGSKEEKQPAAAAGAGASTTGSVQGNVSSQKGR